MIRRDERATVRPDQWFLFTQREHARFAAKLARLWQIAGDDRMEPRQEILNAISSHDDGWVEWDDNPQVRDGRPLAFDEMATADSLSIWRTSIERGRYFGPLEAFAIAYHFSRLLRAHDHWKQDANDRRLAACFLDWTEGLQEACAIEWTNLASENTVAQCLQAAEFVRLFDALSIWILSAERTEPVILETPAGIPLTFTPQSPRLIVVAPWPYELGQLCVSAIGRSVPICNYTSERDLANAESSEITLTWNLVPESKVRTP